VRIFNGEILKLDDCEKLIIPYTYTPNNYIIGNHFPNHLRRERERRFFERHLPCAAHEYNIYIKIFLIKEGTEARRGG
jgi:hypothetical protein